MENSEKIEAMCLSSKAKKECYINIRSQVIKLLYMIEDEQKGICAADLWFYGFMFELLSANDLCNNELTRVVVKIHGLYDKSNYKNMSHSQIKKQIMECKGILDHLILDIK